MDVMRKTRQTTYLFIALALLFYAIHLFPRSMLGFILGQTIGLVNARMLAYRIQHIGGAQKSNIPIRPGIGTGIRMTLVAIGVLLVLRLSDVFEMLGFVIGLSLMPFNVLVWGIWHAKKTQSS
ncbi:MAG: ATP synthase subunit I [Candidatus Carbobacillus sp.]|nr:ATP synthase subunit I [Candidatus Carbobacillus sp.]